MRDEFIAHDQLAVEKCSNKTHFGCETNGVLTLSGHHDLKWLSTSANSEIGKRHRLVQNTLRLLYQLQNDKCTASQGEHELSKIVSR